MTSQVDISVIAPCLNEEGNILALVERVHDAMVACGLSYELILVDDGSSDSTWQLIKSMQETQGVCVRGVKHDRNQGIVRAWLSGLQNARAQIASLIDADLQNPPEAIHDLWLELMSGRCSIAQGVRSSIEWDRDARFVASRSLNTLLNAVFRDQAQDSKSGFVVAPTSVLQDILSMDRTYRYPQTFIRVAALSKGYTVAEVETLFSPRRSGKSFLADKPKLRVYGHVLMDVVRARGEFGQGKRHPVDESFASQTLEMAHPRVSQGAALTTGLRVYFATMPAHAWLLRPKTKNLYAWLIESQWASPDSMRQLQFQRARRMLWHAYMTVPYYQHVFDEAGFHPRHFTSLDDLALIPFLGKQDVTANLYMRLFSRTHKKRDMLKISTSGSTGQPFVTFADRQQLEFRFATTLRSLEWTGWRFGEPQVRLWHQRLGMSPSQVLRERLDARLMRRTFVPAFELDEIKMTELVATLNRVKPTLIDGYAESLNFLAQYLATGRELSFSPKGLLSSAQMLTSQTRKQIESALGAKVHDKYGAREFSGIAYQCRESDYKHVMDESYIVEVIKDGRPAQPGEVGEVVITDLNNFSVPLIRYRIGDLAQAVDNSSICDCGRGLSLLGEIQGRTQAIVHCANGRWLPGTFFAHFFKDYEHVIKYFQVVQEEQGAFTLRVVKGSHWSEGEWESVLRQLREYIGETEVRMEYVDAVPLLATGKRTPVISHVSLDFQTL